MSLECGCVPGHRMIEPQGACADCGLTEMEVEELGRNNLPPCLPVPDGRAMGTALGRGLAVCLDILRGR